jgi:hypothetical protein
VSHVVNTVSAGAQVGWYTRARRFLPRLVWTRAYASTSSNPGGLGGRTVVASEIPSSFCCGDLRFFLLR